jgi:cation transport ATPase
MNMRHIQAGIGLILLYYVVLVGGLYVGLLEPRTAFVVSTGSSVILIIMAGVLGNILLHGEL